MKKSLFAASMLGMLAFSLIIFSCKKSNNQPVDSGKTKIVTGSWTQSDIVLGVDVSVKVGGTKYSFPAGTSVITNPYLQAFGVSQFFEPTTANIYSFTGDGAYKIDGKTDVILPVAGNAGVWALDVYDAVLKLTSPDKKNDPHWINAISSDSLSLSMIVDIPGLGTAPLNLLLVKQK
ncbi:hypothetical protein ACX0G9_03080 [Flavitalea flava]